MITRQELLNTSVTKILTQGKPSFVILDDAGYYKINCKYRSDDGCGCGAAPFIVNYNPEMEGSDWKKIVRNFPADIAQGLGDFQNSFITMLQNAHDCSANAALDKITGILDSEKFLTLYKEAIRDIAAHWILELPSVMVNAE